MSVIGSKAHLVQPRMSPFGTNRTNRGVPMMSVVPGRPEVAGGWPTTRLTQNGPRAASGRIKIFAIANSIMDIIARQGRQNFRKKQFRHYGGRRGEIERGNARVRLGMDHCIRRQQVRSADQAEVSRMAETARSSGSGSSQPSGRPPRPAARPHHCERRSASRPPWRRSLWPPR